MDFEFLIFRLVDFDLLFRLVSVLDCCYRLKIEAEHSRCCAPIVCTTPLCVILFILLSYLVGYEKWYRQFKSVIVGDIMMIRV